MYAAIERVAPAPYVEEMLTQAALDRGDLSAAWFHARRLPQSPVRDEMLGTIALARGDERDAENFFVAADDVFAITNAVDRLAKHDTAAAYRLEERLAERLQGDATHPDALAEAYWRLGRLATAIAYGNVSTRQRWFARGMDDYRQAVALAPQSERYLIAAGVQALHLGDNGAAKQYFRRAADADPASADAYAGLGMAHLRLGDRASAEAYAAQSRAYNPHSHFLRSLEAQLGKQ